MNNNWQEKRDNWKPSERFQKREIQKKKEKLIKKIPLCYHSWWKYLSIDKKNKIINHYLNLDNYSIDFYMSISAFWKWCYKNYQPDKLDVRKSKIKDIYKDE